MWHACLLESTQDSFMVLVIYLWLIPAIQSDMSDHHVPLTQPQVEPGSDVAYNVLLNACSIPNRIVDGDCDSLGAWTVTVPHGAKISPRHCPWNSKSPAHFIEHLELFSYAFKCEILVGDWIGSVHMAVHPRKNTACLPALSLKNWSYRHSRNAIHGLSIWEVIY